MKAAPHRSEGGRGVLCFCPDFSDILFEKNREKLVSSQTRFARLLGISVRTLHHWEQGSRTPSGAAQVLLRVAARHPEAILDAAA